MRAGPDLLLPTPQPRGRPGPGAGGGGEQSAAAAVASKPKIQEADLADCGGVGVDRVGSASLVGDFGSFWYLSTENQIAERTERILVIARSRLQAFSDATLMTFPTAMGGAPKGDLCPLHLNQQFGLDRVVFLHTLFGCITASARAVIPASA